MIPTYASASKTVASIFDVITISCAIYSNDAYIPYFDVYCDGTLIGKTDTGNSSAITTFSDIEYMIPDCTEAFSDFSNEYAELEFVMREYYGDEINLQPCSFKVKVSRPDPPSVTIEGSNVGEGIIGEGIVIHISGIARAFVLNAKVKSNKEYISSFNENYDSFPSNYAIDDDEPLLPEYDPTTFLETYTYWTPDYEICKLFPTQKEETCTIILEIYANDVLYRETETQFRLKVPENDITKPAISSVEILPVSTLEGDMASLYLRGKTGLKANIDAESTYSTIAEYSVNVGHVSAKGNPAVIDALADSGELTATVKVTDARGFVRTVTQDIYIYPYSRPKIVPYTGYTDIICERAKATGELHSDGSYLAIMAGKRFTSIVHNGVELNSCRLRYRYKPTTTDAFGDWVTLLEDGSTETEIQLLAGNVVSDTNTSYDIELSVIDAVGTEHVIRFAVMTSAISFVLYDGVDGAAFGKYPEEPHVVDVASHMTLRVRGRLEVLGASWDSLNLADGMEESPHAYGRQDDTGCYYQVSNGNHVQVAFNCSYHYAGTAQVVNMTPIPEEYRPERTVCSICPANDRRLALVTVKPDGYIRIEWIQTIASSSNTTSATVLWVDGYLDYWV